MNQRKPQLALVGLAIPVFLGCASEGAVVTVEAPEGGAAELAAPDCDCDCAKKGRPKNCQDGKSPTLTRRGTSVEPGSIPLADSPRKGAADPEVVIVLASEFECPYCARVNATLKRIMETYRDRVALVYKHNPLPFHKNAMSAAIAAEAAYRQGYFWEMYEVLFANQGSLGREKYLEWAGTLGLDVDTFERDLEDPALKERVTRDQELVRSLGGRGVPSFWINGRHVVGAQPFENLKSVIDAELE